MNNWNERDQDGQRFVEQNREAWNSMADAGHILASPIRDEELRDPLKIIDGNGWLRGGIQGWNVLCLAAGGGRHGPLYSAAGANVTVVDLSPAMLELDRRVAEEKGLRIRTIETSMDRLDGFADAEFDLVIHPVSTCYLPSLSALFLGIARITRPGGLYISQHKQPMNLQASLDTVTGSYYVQHAYYDKTPVAQPQQPTKLREPGTNEFVHSWTNIIGGICQAGFLVEDLSEPLHGKTDAPVGSFHHRCYYIPPYVRLKARRAGNQERLVLQ